MTDPLSLYARLDVEPDATFDEIKSAYRKRVMDCHPDRFPDDEAKKAEFIALQEAYDVLSDPAKRATYDEYGVADTQAQADKARSSAMQHLTALFTSVTLNMDAPEVNNPLNFLREQVAGKITALSQSKAAILAKQRRMTVVAQRISRRTDTDFLKVAAEEAVKQAQAELHNTEHMIEISRIMLAILDGYDYRTDPVPGFPTQSYDNYFVIRSNNTFSGSIKPTGS